MPVRLPHLLSKRGRSRTEPAPGGRRRSARGEHCQACGEALAGGDHAIRLPRGIFHAGCVLYQPREIPAPPPGSLRTAR